MESPVSTFKSQFQNSQVAYCITSSLTTLERICERSRGLLLLLASCAVALSGCGAGGYAGGGLTSISVGGQTRARITIDAGERIRVTADNPGNLPLTWELKGSSCSGTACGAVDADPSTATSNDAIYTAPVSVSTQMVVELDARVSGTQIRTSVMITVNPALAITANTPSGIVGKSYTGFVGSAGGSPAVSLSMIHGNLPDGLAYEASTGNITGTPTAAGTASFTIHATDQSDVPTAITAVQQIAIGVAGTVLSVTGNPPAAVLGVPYMATLQASGGTQPYAWTISSGNLPAGLKLSTSGVITGNPTTVGASTFVATATDAASAVASASFRIAVTASASTGTLTIGTGSLPTGTVSVPYSSSVAIAGGTGPYTCSIVGGTLPAGLSLGAGCAIAGTPTVAGFRSITLRATDSSNPALTGTGTLSIIITNAVASQLTVGALPNGTVGAVYSATIPVTGGVAPYTCTLASGTLPAGLLLGANCTTTGVPTGAGTSTPSITIRDTSDPQKTLTAPVSITIAPATLTVSVGTMPSGTVGIIYTQPITIEGGTGPYTCTVDSGALPTGLTLGANCTVSGIPALADSDTVVITIRDSGNPAQRVRTRIKLTIVPVAVQITAGTLPTGTVNIPYSQPIPIAGGVGPYTCALASGALPAGLSLGAGCRVSGTPTTAGASTGMIIIQDSANPPQSITESIGINIGANGFMVTNGTLPRGRVGVTYTQSIPIVGGTAPYACTLASGALPPGLILRPECTFVGVPSALGTYLPQVTVHDASNPQQVLTAAISISIDGTLLSIGTSSLPGGTVGLAYMQTIPVVGGTGPYTCSLASGTLPTGLSLGAGCTVAGLPTASGLSAPVITVHDASNPAETATAPVSIVINPAPVGLNAGTLPNGTVGTVYAATLPIIGGTGPYSCTLGAGALPAGLHVGAACAITGTPTSAGTSTPTINITDSSVPALTIAEAVSITIVAEPATLAIGAPPAATVSVPYIGTIQVTGGTAPYNCQVVGGMVAGLTVNANCSVTGTPTTAEATPITISVTDSSRPSINTTGTVVITVSAPTTTLTLTPPPAATVTVPYTGSIGVTGGAGPYTCTAPVGSMPDGLTLNANCSIIGTPTTVAVTNITVTATDSANPAHVTIGTVPISVEAVSALTFSGSLPNAIVGVPYTQTLRAAGGVGPYTYAITSSTLPTGLSLATDGTISGTPTAAGAVSFTITATDAEGTPRTANLPLVLLVVYPTTPDDAKLQGQYAYLFQGSDDAVAGVASYHTATAASFTADGNGVVSAGEMDSNHQSSNPTGNTINARQFIGTYTIGTDLRGLLTLSTLATNGTVRSTNTYAIALRTPVSPGTVASTASMVQFDGNQLGGTKGSGTMLLQDQTKFAAGLTGSYVFGLEGDAPCFPTCTLGLIAGPAASVGKITASGGTINGTGDANLGATNYSQSTLAGSYGAADANGRIQLSMTTSKLTGVPFPTDYAVYVVDASHLFVISTDKHSSFVLQSGTAQLQTQSAFDATSMNGPFVGYENSPVNPGLVGATLQSVANLSSSTIFQGAGQGNGTCKTNTVDTGGTAGLVTAIAGVVGGGAPLIGDLLGTYQSVGNSNCAVAPNGRVVLNYPAPSAVLSNLLALLGVQAQAPAPRIVYLVSPNNGYFLESSYAGVGTIESQIGAPFTTATLNGRFVYGQIPTSTIATLNSSGEFIADGAGHTTSTLDENVGVGTLNVLQLGVTGSDTYTLTDAAIGRFTLGNYGTIYAIAPGRFVLLQTDALGTAPYIALLY
jgi:hypothetical protein